MNQTTQDVVAFLDFPDLDLGTTPLDLEMIANPALMRELTERLLSGPLPTGESRAAADALAGRLGDADWAEISAVMRGRVGLTDALFDTSVQDAELG